MDAELFLGKDQEEVEESTTPYQVSRLLQEAFYKADKVRTHREMGCQPLVATYCTDSFKMVPMHKAHASPESCFCQKVLVSYNAATGEDLRGLNVCISAKRSYND